MEDKPFNLLIESIKEMEQHMLQQGNKEGSSNEIIMKKVLEENDALSKDGSASKDDITD